MPSSTTRVASMMMLAAAGGTGAATGFPPLVRQPLLDVSPPPIRVTNVKGALIRFAPGQPTGLHSHPSPVVGTVTEGTFLVQVAGQPMRTLRKGDAFYEPAGTPIIHFDNASASRSASISAFYLIDDPSKPLISMSPVRD